MTTRSQLQLFNRLVGAWTTEATHPMMPGLVVHGTATFEWLEGERFLIVRSRTDHPQFPDAISIIGNTDHDQESADHKALPDDGPLHMQYFDSRGVFRIYDVSIDEAAWRWFRDAPGFSQQFTGTFIDDGNTVDGLSKLRRDDVHWEDDLKITYRRQR